MSVYLFITMIFFFKEQRMFTTQSTPLLIFLAALCWRGCRSLLFSLKRLKDRFRSVDSRPVHRLYFFSFLISPSSLKMVENGFCIQYFCSYITNILNVIPPKTFALIAVSYHHTTAAVFHDHAILISISVLHTLWAVTKRAANNNLIVTFLH